MMILIRTGRAPHFRLSSATLPKSEIAVVLELSMKIKKEASLSSKSGTMDYDKTDVIHSFFNYLIKKRKKEKKNRCRNSGFYVFFRH